MSEKKDTKRAEELLVGKTIISVEYLSEEEMNRHRWFCRPLCIKFNDGSEIMFLRDDEGNDGGAAFYTKDMEGEVLGVLW